MGRVSRLLAGALGIAVISGAAFVGCARAPGVPARAPAGVRPPFVGYASERYRDPAAWLCLPEMGGDACHRDLGATELRADGSRVVVANARAPAADTGVDCFYLYPTVDMSLAPKNHDDFEDLAPMASATIAQAARFRDVCSLYVPLYRQVTIGTYLRGEAASEPYLAVAFSDVADAFMHYMGQRNRDRKLVLLGHSQGAEMIVRLLQKYFDGDDAATATMREHLLVAMPIGGKVEVKKGSAVGGTFARLPLCTRDDERACVVAFRSYRAGTEVRSSGYAPRAGNVTACVNPADLAGSGNARAFSRTYFPILERVRDKMRGIDGVATPFVALPGFYTGRCVDGEGGFRYLEIDDARAADDKRTSPIDLEDRRFETRMGLHVLDMQFPQGDLIEIVARRAHAPSNGEARP